MNITQRIRKKYWFYWKGLKKTPTDLRFRIVRWWAGGFPPGSASRALHTAPGNMTSEIDTLYISVTYIQIHIQGVPKLTQR